MKLQVHVYDEFDLSLDRIVNVHFYIEKKKENKIIFLSIYFFLSVKMG